MPETDLPLLIDAVQKAGTIAAGFTGPTVNRWDKADGAGPVTEADLAVNQSLSDSLRTARPDYGWLSEETEDDKTRLDHTRVFIVDPIDGTRSFVEGQNTWAISVAIADAGQIVAGVVLMPMRNRLYAAGLGLGATLNGTKLRVSEPAARPRVLAAKPNFDSKHWSSGVPDMDRHYRPSLAFRLALVGAGTFDAMLTLRKTWEWDIAAGSLIVSEANGRVSDRTGARLRFNNADPIVNGIVAASDPLHQTILDKLEKPRG